MEMTDFAVKQVKGGFFLYYKNHFLGGQLCKFGEIHRTAALEIQNILHGSGWKGYMAVIHSLEKKRKEELQLCLF